MPSTVKPLSINAATPDYIAWQENHALKHAVLDAAISSIPAQQTPIAPTTSSGNYLPQFNAGDVQFAGPNGTFLGNDNLIFGTGIPNPSHDFPSGGGVSLLIGTGGTANPNRDAWIITDQAFDPTLDGNMLGITAGETQGSGVANGGLLWLLGGGAFGGTGGEMRVQGGTSRNGPGGPLNLFGGNSSTGIPGDVFVVAGQAGTQGANIHLIMTVIDGIPGFLRIRANSSILYEFDATGAIFIGATGAGLAGQPLVSGGPTASTVWFSGGFTGTIVVAALTGAGTQGSITFASGLCTGIVQPT